MKRRWQDWMPRPVAVVAARLLSRVDWRLLRPMLKPLSRLEDAPEILRILQEHRRRRNAIRTLPPEPWTVSEAIASLARSGGSIKLFGTVRLLQAAHRSRVSLGYGLRPEDEAIRLEQGVVLGFTGLEVAAVRLGNAGFALAPDVDGNASASLSAAGANVGARSGRIIVAQHAVGLLGPNGPMPFVWTQNLHCPADAGWQRHDGDARRWKSDRDTYHTRPKARRDGMLALFNLVQRRQLSFFYRAWSDSQVITAFDSAEGTLFERQPIANRLRAIAGVAQADMVRCDAVPQDFKLAFASSLGLRVRSPLALAAMVQRFLGAPVKVEEFSARWIDVPEDQQTGLGVQYSTLGDDTVVGRRCWDAGSSFDVVVGPLSMAQYENLLPHPNGVEAPVAGSGAAFEQLQDLIALYCGAEWEWRLVLVLKSDQVPAWRLPSGGGEAEGLAPECGVRLGWTSWLGARVGERHATDLALPMAADLQRRHTPILHQEDEFRDDFVEMDVP